MLSYGSKKLRVETRAAETQCERLSLLDGMKTHLFAPYSLQIIDLPAQRSHGSLRTGA